MGKEKQPETPADIWRDLERKARDAEAKAEAARDAANAAGSKIAAVLIEEHKSSAIQLDGTRYVPKAAPTRKDKASGAEKPPKYPYQMVRAPERGTADL